MYLEYMTNKNHNSYIPNKFYGLQIFMTCSSPKRQMPEIKNLRER
uniref:Uncharacterized protein n=1 Tax=Arundo donax TaxID=35708 RepID=A0A0A9E3X8_ARUDO